MADFDLEQLKTLFENLGDRLERTKGDELSRDELYRIRQMLTRMSNQANNAKGSELNPQDLVNEFFKEWKTQDPLKGLRDRGTTGQPRRTIIQEEQARRRGDTQGFTFLDRELRGSGNEVDQFGRSVDKAGTDATTFSKRLQAAQGAFGAAAGAASSIFTKMVDVGAERIDYYRDVLASGEGTIDSMQDLGRQTVAAGVTVEQFAKAMKEGTQGARLLGGIRWLQLNKAVTEMTRSSGSMGMTVEQLQAASQDYSEILRMQGLSRDRSTEQMAQGMISLVRSGEATANILGKTREEALASQKEQASNSNVQASMTAQGFNDNQRQALNDLAVTFANTYGEAGKTLINDIIQFGQPLNKSATELAATLPEIQDIARNRVANVKGNQNVDVEQSNYATARAIRGLSQNLTKDRSRLGQYANLGALSDSALSGNFTSITGGILAGNNLNTNIQRNAGTRQDQGSEERRAGVGVLQLNQIAQDFKVASEAAINAVFNPMVSEYGPYLRNTVNPALHDFANMLISMANGAEKNTSLMANLGVAALGLAGAFTLFSSAIGIASKTLGIFGSLGRGFGALFARGGAAAATAGAGEAAAGGLLAGAALPLAGIAAGGLGIYAGGSMIQNRQGESFLGTGQNEKGFFGSRATGYGTAAAGGALTGAAIGSLIPVFGTAIGAGIGGLAGLGYAWWNDSSGNASQAPQTTRTPTRAPMAGSRSQPANATGQRNRNVLTMDQMTNKIMEASDRSANYLKSIKDATEQQVATMREDIAVARGVGERLARLLEEGNRNMKLLAEHSI